MSVKTLNIAYFFLFSFNGLCTAIQLAFLNAEWSTMSSTSRFLVVTAIFQNWTGTMLAFMFKAINRVEHGKAIIGEDTQSWSKTDVQQTTIEKTTDKS